MREQVHEPCAEGGCADIREVGQDPPEVVHLHEGGTVVKIINHDAYPLYPGYRITSERTYPNDLMATMNSSGESETSGSKEYPRPA